MFHARRRKSFKEILKPSFFTVKPQESLKNKEKNSRVIENPFPTYIAMDHGLYTFYYSLSTE